MFVGWLRIERGKCIRLQEHLTVLTEQETGVLFSAVPAETTAITAGATEARMRLTMGLVAVHLATHRAGGNEDAHPRTAASMGDTVVEAIRRHIEESAGKHVTLDFLAHFSGYSKFHLLRLFRTRVGCTIHQYIDQAALTARARCARTAPPSAPSPRRSAFPAPPRFTAGDGSRPPDLRR